MTAQITENTIVDSLLMFQNHVNEVLKGYNVAGQYKCLSGIPGKNWTKLAVEIRSKEDNKLISSSAYAFVSMTDNYTKTLGQLVLGGIYKPASWNAPAKHARGNVFDEKSWTCAGEYGIAYLK